MTLPIGFDLDWRLYLGDPLSSDAWFAIRDLQSKQELRELCPTNDLWSFKAETENAQRIITHLAQFACIRLVNP